MPINASTGEVVVVKLRGPQPFVAEKRGHKMVLGRNALQAALGGLEPEAAFTNADDNDHGLIGDPAPGAAPDRSQFIQVPVDSPAAADALIARLQQSGQVEWAWRRAVPVVQELRQEIDFAEAIQERVGDAADYTSFQQYLEDAPLGLGIRSAWAASHGRAGRGVRAGDVEYGWVVDHDDIIGAPVHVRGAMTTKEDHLDHGTACLGMLVARRDGCGITGIAPHVDAVYCYAALGVDFKSAADAVDLAASSLERGDVLLIELEIPGPVGLRLVPLEWDELAYVAVRKATDRGIIVVASAGNGAQDLDHADLGGAFDRTKRDSGAILVGAGIPPGATGMTDCARVGLSNWGSRVDVQGYGGQVYTTGYGDLRRGPADDRRKRYTKSFRGTSSAAAMVWGACVLLQGIAKRSGRTLAPREMRTLLARTGTPQAGDLACCIGPRPDLKKALAELGLPP